jgi:hypothetical protein
MLVRILTLLLLPVICLAQVNSNGEKPTGELLSNEISPNEMKYNASFNLDEIKVRWKKAALENCTGAPCASISAPGPVTSIAATPTGPTSVSVSFVPPASTGGSPITGYEATATPTSSAPAKRKSSATITVKGDKSPIEIPGLTPGTNYIFTVVALNAAGVSPPTVTVTPVAPCTLNTATASTPQPEINLGTTYANSDAKTIATTTGATGIGTATGLPTGMTATWSNNIIKISGTPTGTPTSFNYTIPLTGGCGNVNATGTIVVLATLPPQCVAAIQTENTIFQSEEIINLVPPRILFKTSGVTGIETLAIGLPEDMAVLWDSDNKYILIYGNSPRILGLVQTFNFSIDLIGPACQGKKAIGEITIIPAQ